MFDTFFDCLNVSSLSRGHLKRKKYCYPYRSADDERLKVSSICTLLCVHMYMCMHIVAGK